MQLIVIQGGAATGKSTLANHLADVLDMPQLRKDIYKERMYDKAGKRLNLWSWLKLEKTSYTELIKAIEEVIKTDTSIIVEANFLPHHGRKLHAALQPGCTVVEIYCYAKGWRMFQRYVTRNENGTRHPGHRDRLWYGIVLLEALSAQARWRWYRPLKLSKHLYKVDTSTPDKIPHKAIVHFIKAAD
jgi:predicted kinase